MHAGHFNGSLVLLSVFAAVVSSYMSLDLERRSIKIRHTLRSAVIRHSGSAILGIGIWIVHYIGMLAYHPSAPIQDQLPTMLLSIAFAVAGSFAAAALAGSRSPYRFVWSGVCLGVGIHAMHYTSMEAIKGDYEVHYHPFLLTASVLAAMIVSLGSMYKIFQIRNLARPAEFGWRLKHAAWLGAAVAAMNYTGVLAATFVPLDEMLSGEMASLSHTYAQLSSGGPPYWAAGALLLIAGFMMLGIYLDRCLAYETSGLPPHHAAALFEQNPDGVLSLDLNGRIVGSNPAAEKLTGLTKDALMGLSGRSLAADIGGGPFDQWPGQARQEPPLPFSGVPPGVAAGAADLQVTAFPFRLGRRIRGAFAVLRDFSEQQREEARLRKADKLSMAGRLAASVAHEIRNPLTTVVGMVKLIQRGRAREEYFELIFAEIRAIETIVADFLLLSEMHRHDWEHCSLASLLQGVLERVREQAEAAGIRMNMNNGATSALVRCQAAKLKQALYHLLKNTIESMNDGGDIVISLYSTDSHDVMVRISDPAGKAPPEWHASLGEPFYSTKSRGTGIGLMISYHIILAHEGRVELRSGTADGNVIEVTLPLAGIS